jgi:glycosyltransferase involved in cell wall biosynthesis
MKKSILFVIDSLDCAGAEKSLVTLLTLLDYSKYDVDLQLFGYGGALEKLLPKEVNLLEPMDYTQFAKLTLKESLIYSIRNRGLDLLLARFRYSLGIRKKNYRNSQIARIYWESVSKVISVNEKQYDIAISYAQGVPTFFVADKVKAKKKFAWVNVTYRLDEEDKTFQEKLYDEFNKIIAVSDSAKEIFIETFPHLSKKMGVIYDINNPELIIDMAKIDRGYKDDFNGIRILTIGRLNQQKGYDIAIDACKMLKDKGINFRWYALGKGPLEVELKEKINQYGLLSHFILLGVEPNPYPYIKNADIYVQTSRFEGFGLAIAEARMLNVPVITTKFDAVFNQMIDKKNGLVVEMNANAVKDGVVQLIEDIELREEIIQYLKNEKKGNIGEIEKFYKLIG